MLLNLDITPIEFNQYYTNANGVAIISDPLIAAVNIGDTIELYDRSDGFTIVGRISQVLTDPCVFQTNCGAIGFQVEGVRKDE